MKNLFIIHIGLGKTGTSAVQHFLIDNRKFLRTAGLLYPKTGLRGAAQHELSESFGMGGLPKKKLLELMKRRIQLWNELKEEVNSFDGNVLISSEDWPVNLREYKSEDEPIAYIKSCFPDYDVKILVYLRRQDQHAQSAYNQWIKTGVLKDNEKPFDFCKRYAIDYRALLKPIAQSVGKENVIVRVYDKTEFFRHNIFTDFLRAVGLIFDQKVLDNLIYHKKNVNPKISIKALQYLRVANSIGDYTHYSERQPFNQLIVKIFQASDQGAAFDNHPLLNRSQIEEILRGKKQSNDFVAREFLGRDILFPEPTGVDGRNTQDAESLCFQPDSVEIAIKVWEHLSEKINRKDQSIEKKVQIIEDLRAKMT